jgi:hypothetical protein
MGLALVVDKKQCKKCNRFLDFSLFSKNAAIKDGLQSKCKECDNKYQRKRRIENKEKVQEYGRIYRETHFNDFDFRIQGLLNASKQRSREKGLDNSLTKDDLKELFPEDGKCPVFGFKLEWNKAGFRDTSPSIDRIDPTKGYVKGNVQIISWKANRIKGYASVEDLEILLAYMKQGD